MMESIGYEINIKNIIAEISKILENAEADDQIFYKESNFRNIKDASENLKIKLLYSILRNLPGPAIAQIKEVLAQDEIAVLDNLLDALRTKTGNLFYDRFDSGDVIDEVGEMLDMSVADTTFYEILVIYIMEAGYKKVSDFYSQLNIERRYWARYKKGFIPPKRKIVEMIIFLQLDYDDAEYLMNMAGMSFQRNSTSDLIVMYFLQNGYSQRMAPESLLILIDEVLENFNQAPIHSEA